MTGKQATWLEYVTWRSKLAISAYDAAFDRAKAFVTKDAYSNARNIHSFFTHAAMVARAYVPSGKAKNGAAERAAFLQKVFPVNTDILKTCIAARNNMDHFDERIDAAVARHGRGFGTGFTMLMPNLARLEKNFQGQPVLAMLAYLKDDHAIVTYDRNEKATVTKLDPIHGQLGHICQCHIAWVDGRLKTAL